MTKLFWQLPWSGPQRDNGPDLHWSVMPSPGMGNAKAVCVPVALDQSKVVLALAAPNAKIPLVAAPMGTWTTLTGVKGTGEIGFLCLLGYDLPEGGLEQNFVVATNIDVDPAQLARGIELLQKQLGDELAKDIVGRKAPLPASARATSGMPPQREAALMEVAPQPDATPVLSLTLAFASCQYPSGLLDGLPAQASYQRLADLLENDRARRPDLLLLVGDQIYADATAGLLDPIRLDDRYRVQYEELLRIEPLHRIMRSGIPISWMLDDHEIADNWEPYVQGAQGSKFRKGVAAFWNYQRHAPQKDETWLTAQGAGWSLFMADTRTHREYRSEATLDDALILGKKQSRKLEDWLQQVDAGSLKLISTSSMLLPRLIEHAEEPLYLDAWQGYPASLHRLLAFVCDNKISNLCFLSGDAHLGCDVDIVITDGTGNEVTTRSIHTPALYAPLPFANEQPWNLNLLHDHFSFQGPKGRYTCEVNGHAMLPHRDGSCLLKADRAGTAWNVTVEVI